MDKLGSVIDVLSLRQEETNYILDCLMSYRDIVNSGDCNTCAQKNCTYKPKPGQLVRYNCFLYVSKEEIE